MIKQLLHLVIAKYRYFSVSRRSIICPSLRLQQIINLLATDKSRHFAQPRPIIVNYYHNKSSMFVYFCLFALIELIIYVIFVLSHKQPLSATNFLYELDKITQEIVTVSHSQLVFSQICMYHCQALQQ